MRKIAGKKNPADLLTKFLSGDELKRKVGLLGMKVCRGRSTAVDEI